MQARLIFTLVLMVVVVIFSLANADPVPFNYLFGLGEISLALIIIVAALIGAIAGVLSNLSSQLQLRNELNDKERQLRELSRDKNSLVDEVEAQRIKKKRRNRRDQG